MTRASGGDDMVNDEPALGGLAPASSRPMPTISEVRLLRAAEELAAQLREVGDVEKAARIAVRFAGTMLRADHRCLALLDPGRAEASVVFTGVREPRGESWPLRMLADFARARKPEIPANVAVARLRRRRRPWATMALRWLGAEPDWNARNALTRLAAVTNDAIDRIESRRLAEVRARIDRKIMEQLRPKDLLYQILDGLRSLTGYDHSGAILLRDAGTWSFELVAEQLAFRKGKSPRIGAFVTMQEALRGSLRPGEVRGYSAADGVWKPWSEQSSCALADWASGGLPPLASDNPPESERLCAPLWAGAELTGLLQISALHHGTFGDYEAELLGAFIPHAMIALQNARRAQSLEDKMIEAERKHAMAELARGVSHDINNAFGSILPLVQQMREDVDQARADRTTLAADLAQIEQSLRTCTRIFGGMLQFARRAAHDPGGAEARLDTAIEGSMTILGEGLRRIGIEVTTNLAEDLPALPMRQTELEQLLLNLIGNARDAMAAAGRGGRLGIEARTAATPERKLMVRLEVSDTGVGIPADDLPRVQEPFFTTKPGGNGLGLTICRSIVWQAGGRMTIESPAGLGFDPARPGTRVSIELPAAGNAKAGSTGARG